MPQIIVCEWRVIFSENLLHKIGYPFKDPWLKVELALSHLRIYVQILCLLTVFRYCSLLVGALIKPGEGSSRGLP